MNAFDPNRLFSCFLGGLSDIDSHARFITQTESSTALQEIWKDPVHTTKKETLFKMTQAVDPLDPAQFGSIQRIWKKTMTGIETGALKTDEDFSNVIQAIRNQPQPPLTLPIHANHLLSKTDLVVFTDPALANSCPNGVSAVEYQEIASILDAVAQNRSTIRLSASSSQGQKADLLLALAKLMTRKLGRDLVRSLLASGEIIQLEMGAKPEASNKTATDPYRITLIPTGEPMIVQLPNGQRQSHFTPLEIILAHELVHVRHDILKQFCNPAAAFLRPHFHTPEEQRTILGFFGDFLDIYSENAIRAEFGLLPRYCHREGILPYLDVMLKPKKAIELDLVGDLDKLFSTYPDLFSFPALTSWLTLAFSADAPDVTAWLLDKWLRASGGQKAVLDKRFPALLSAMCFKAPLETFKQFVRSPLVQQNLSSLNSALLFHALLDPSKVDFLLNAMNLDLTRWVAHKETPLAIVSSPRLCTFLYGKDLSTPDRLALIDLLVKKGDRPIPAAALELALKEKAYSLAQTLIEAGAPLPPDTAPLLRQVLDAKHVPLIRSLETRLPLSPLFLSFEPVVTETQRLQQQLSVRLILGDDEEFAETVAEATNAGLNLNFIDEQGNGLLQFASPTQMRILLEAGANPCPINPLTGETPLHQAARQLNLNALSLLMENGAPPEITEQVFELMGEAMRKDPLGLIRSLSALSIENPAQAEALFLESIAPLPADEFDTLVKAIRGQKNVSPQLYRLFQPLMLNAAVEKVSLPSAASLLQDPPVDPALHAQVSAWLAGRKAAVLVAAPSV